MKTWKLILVGTLCLLIAGVTPTRSATPEAPDPPGITSVTDPAQHPPPGAGVPVAPPPHPKLPEPKFWPENDPPRTELAYTRSWWGQVTAVDQFSITLRARGEPQPKRFPAGGTLVGLPPRGTSLSSGHSLSDVRVGDVVCIQYYHDPQRGIFEECYSILIYRRPGGKITPRPGELAPVGAKWHEAMQAYQDWEEQGIPIPPHISLPAPYMLGVPFPPVAPMPRSASPRPKT